MSKPAPPTKSQNFLQTALFMMLIFTGVQLWMQTQQAPATPPGDLYVALQKQNRELLDVTASHTLAQYNKVVDEQVKQKKLTADEGQKKKIEAIVWVADTQFKAGIKGNKTDRIRDAYNTLALSNRHLRDQKIWNTTFAVTDVSGDKRFGWKEWSGQSLYDRVVRTLSERDKNELVWGFIPGYQLMDFLVHLTGANPTYSYALAGFFLALLVRSAVFKLATKQIMSGRQMSQLMPLVKEIKDKYSNDQVAQNTKTMELYKEYGVNPFAGCGPALVQMPLFYTIYQCMLHYQFEFQKGTFLWINPDVSRQTGGFVAPNLGQQDTILVIIYGVTMLVTTLLTPVSDPTQAKQQRLMGIGVTVMFTAFMFTGAVPVVSGFVLYWIFTNLLATTQSLVLYRRKLPPLEKVNTKPGGVYPKPEPKGFMGKMMAEMQKAQEEQMRKMGENGGEPGGGIKNPTSKPSGPSPTVFTGTGETKTGSPAKHKPKKRK